LTEVGARLRGHLVRGSVAGAAVVGMAWLVGSRMWHPVSLAGLHATFSCADRRLTVAGRVSPPNNAVRSVSLLVVGDRVEVEVLGSWWLPNEMPPRWSFSTSTVVRGDIVPVAVSTRPPAHARSVPVALDETCASRLRER
jgi:hypothetical protein